MEKNRSAKAIAVLALLVAVAGVSIGFAAFSNTLTISSGATVKANPDNFKVYFSSSETEQAENLIVATGTGEGANAIIDNSSKQKLTNVSATFTEPGQSVVYTLYAHNAGKYVAYLNSVLFKNASGQTTTKVCTPVTGTTAALVAQACEGISLSVSVGAGSGNTYAGSIDTIDDHTLDIDSYEPVYVTIDYAAGSAIADGDFKVSFGDIELQYDSAD